MSVGRFIGVLNPSMPDLQGVQYVTVDVADDKGMCVLRIGIMFP